MSGFGPVNELVPHRPPMLLIDEVLSWSEPVVRCASTIDQDDLFVEGTAVDAVVAVEYMAQCVAVYGGLLRRAKGQPVTLGFLVGCSELELFRARINVGTRLIVEARLDWNTEDGMGIFNTKVLDGDSMVACAKLYVFEGGLEERPLSAERGE